VWWGEYANQPRPVNACVSTGVYACGVGMRREDLRRLLGAAVGVGLWSGATPAAADETASAMAPYNEALARPPPPRKAYLQYGVAFTVEGVVSAGPVCAGADASRPCILGSGGGVDIRVGWRPTENFYIGGAYEFSKQEPNKLFRLAILQQARGEARHYFPTGKSAEPFVLVGAGVAGYGNEWTVSTWGPSGTLGGGVELELSGGSLLCASLAYRPILLQSFLDPIPIRREAGVVHFITLEIALEAQDTF
jgi:hypothetical protein